MTSSWYNKGMPNKTRFIIDPTKEYVVKLDNGEEVVINGTVIINIAESINNHKRANERLKELDEIGKAWL